MIPGTSTFRNRGAVLLRLGLGRRKARPDDIPRPKSFGPMAATSIVRSAREGSVSIDGFLASLASRSRRGSTSTCYVGPRDRTVVAIKSWPSTGTIAREMQACGVSRSPQLPSRRGLRGSRLKDRQIPWPARPAPSQPPSSSGCDQRVLTLAVLALAMSLLGIGNGSAIFALFLASLLPIVSNTMAGLRAVPPHLLEAARGMGLSPRHSLVQVELPNSPFVIYTGIRTALAINVGTVPLASPIGGGGLGELIFTGIALNEFGTMLAGAIPTALLAVLIDFVIAQLQFWTIPRGVNPLR